MESAPAVAEANTDVEAGVIPEPIPAEAERAEAFPGIAVISGQQITNPKRLQRLRRFLEMDLSRRAAFCTISIYTSLFICPLDWIATQVHRNGDDPTPGCQCKRPRKLDIVAIGSVDWVRSSQEVRQANNHSSVNAESYRGDGFPVTLSRRKLARSDGFGRPTLAAKRHGGLKQHNVIS